MKKLIAGFLTAMISLLSVSMPAIAASQLGSYPDFLADAADALDAFVVVGAAAAVDDVVGAVDIAVRLAEVGTSSVSQACTGASAAVDGTSKDTCDLGHPLSSCFPSSAVLKTAHYSGLKDTVYTWDGDGQEYDYREQVDFSGVTLSHDLSVTNVNGTETMVIASDDIKYQLVFEERLSGLGSISNPNYTYPVNIEILGTAFSIVGTSAANTVRVLQGSIGTATATSGVTYGDYTAYSDLGSNAAWARIVIKDSAGNTVDTLIVNQGVSKQSTAAGLTVMPTSISALMDGTVVGVDLVIGSTTEGIVKTYDVTADTTSTGTASDRFPGSTAWGIQVGSTSFGTTAGTIQVGDMLEVVYKPGTTEYVRAGSKISLPNDYAELGFQGWNTDKWVTVTIKPIGGTVSAYWHNQTTTVLANLNGIEISADVSGSIISQDAQNAFSKAYVLFNYTATDGNAFPASPVMFGYYDQSNQKILVNGSFTNQGGTAPATEYLSKYVNETAVGTDSVEYQYTICYSNACEDNHFIRVAVNHTGLSVIGAGNATIVDTIRMNFNNRTAATKTAAPEFRLGATVATAESTEINMTTHATVRNAGRLTQEIVDDSGIIAENTNSLGGSDQMVLKFPFKALRVKLYFGKAGEGVSGDTVTYDDYPSIPLTSAVAKLDSEVGATEKASNLILVGGPCKNDVVAELATAGSFSYGCVDWPGRDFGLIEVIDDAFTTGKVVMVVAGTRAADTRTASTVLQQFDTLLSGQTSSAVEVTSATAAGITAV
jgi:hypothetical protein